MYYAQSNNKPNEAIRFRFIVLIFLRPYYCLFVFIRRINNHGNTIADLSIAHINLINIKSISYQYTVSIRDLLT